MSRPNLLTLDIWGRHVKSVIEVFQCALVRLEGESDLPEDENPLNRKVYWFALEENRRLLQEGRGCRSPIMYECRNQPTAETDEPLEHEWKRPDFKCGFVDSESPYPLFLDLECKRLGNRSTGGSVFNKLYTEKGVRRFIDTDSGYGAGVTSGAMIGYLQTMPPDDILNEVNDYAKTVNVPAINGTDRPWINRGVIRLNQKIDRQVAPSPFRLRHLWLDLRRHYSTNAPI